MIIHQAKEEAVTVDDVITTPAPFELAVWRVPREWATAALFE